VNKIVLICLLLAVAILFSQDATFAQRKQGKAKPAATKAGSKSKSKPVGDFGNIEAITAEQLKNYLYFVASDEMEGRDTPSRGLDLTAKFISMNLARWGLKPVGTNGSFFQYFGLIRKQLQPGQTSASINDQNFGIGEDFIARLNNGTATGQMVYVGHGLVIKSKNIDAYQGVDVKDKIMVVADAFPKGVNRSDFSGKPGEAFDFPSTYAHSHGAKGIIIVPNSSALSFWEQRHKSSLNPSRPVPESHQTEGVPTIVASVKMVDAIFQGEKLNYETIKKQMSEGVFGEPFDLSPSKKANLTVSVKVETLKTQNVVAVIEGQDPKLKDEYVAIGAHYDHVGIGSANSNGDKIFNGADDDGSGTVAVLAIAEALSQGPRPKRSVLFVWHAGEEKGLWGSEYIVENPPVPINQIITQLNIDMIGRSKKNGDTNPRNINLSGPNEIYVIGSKMMSTELGELSESVNKSFLNLKFNYKYDAPDDPERFFYRSDHFNYAKKGIPIIFYFDGVHEDYHGLSDHPDKIDYQKMEKVTRTIYATLMKLADAPSRPKVDKPLPAQLAGY
jgi:Zn-dependent M28 family amino/carboxypeptidase